MLTLSLWQISVIAAMAVMAVLLGTLVMIARTLANKVGKAYAALRRIEEGLISASAPGAYASGLGAPMEAVASGHALGSDLRVSDSRIREMPVREMALREATRREVAQREVAVPETLLAEGAAREMSAAGMAAMDVQIPERDRRVSYLTVRDLKVMARSGRRRSDSEVSQEAAAHLSTRLFSTAQSDAASVARPHAGHAAASQRGANEPEANEPGADQPGVGHADAGAGPSALSSSSAVLQELATATSEVRALLNEGVESAGAPMVAVVASDETVAEAQEEMYAYAELSDASVHRLAPEAELRATPEWVADPPAEALRAPVPTPAARDSARIEPAGIAAALEPTPTAAARMAEPLEPARTAASREVALIEAASIDARPINPRSIEAPELPREPDFVLAPSVEFPPAPAEESIEEAAPVAALSNPTTSVEDQPTPPINSDTEAELAEKRRKRTAELILAHHRRRRARGH